MEVDNRVDTLLGLVNQWIRNMIRDPFLFLVPAPGNFDGDFQELLTKYLKHVVTFFFLSTVPQCLSLHSWWYAAHSTRTVSSVVS